VRVLTFSWPAALRRTSRPRVGTSATLAEARAQNANLQTSLMNIGADQAINQVFRHHPAGHLPWVICRLTAAVCA
jgi:hypothetical protein